MGGAARVGGATMQRGLEERGIKVSACIDQF